MAIIKFNCPLCQQRLEAPDEAAGVAVTCPACSQSVEVPIPAAAAASDTANTTGSSPLCAICQSPIGPEEARTPCPTCRAEYHTDCWQENGGCAVYGCAEVPLTQTRQSLEIPVSFWGQEHKPCPACHREILAAAVRCRHCGATFSSARPEDTQEFLDRSAQAQRLPEIRRKVIWTFILCVAPCLSPIGAIYGLSWYPRQRADVAALPSLYPALCKIGLGVAIVQLVLIIVLAALYSVLRSP